MPLKERKGPSASLQDSEPPVGTRIGRVVAFEGGETCVDFEGNRAGPVPARVAAGIDDAALEAAAHEQREAVLLFTGGASAQPIVLALLRSVTPHLDTALSEPLPAGRKVARVDGRRVEIEGHEEVVLRCGKASLTLRRDGKVVLRGVNIVSQADQVHKVRGGKVQIN
jgi:voltage-gated potassium channel Kch